MIGARAADLLLGRGLPRAEDVGVSRGSVSREPSGVHTH
jgi:hypothetical protein